MQGSDDKKVEVPAHRAALDSFLAAAFEASTLWKLRELSVKTLTTAMRRAKEHGLDNSGVVEDLLFSSIGPELTALKRGGEKLEALLGELYDGSVARGWQTSISYASPAQIQVVIGERVLACPRSITEDYYSFFVRAHMALSAILPAEASSEEKIVVDTRSGKDEVLCWLFLSRGHLFQMRRAVEGVCIPGRCLNAAGTSPLFSEAEDFVVEACRSYDEGRAADLARAKKRLMEGAGPSGHPGR